MYDDIPRERLAWYGLTLVVLIIVGTCGCAPGGWDLPVPGEEPVRRPAGPREVTATWSPPCVGPEAPCGGPFHDFVLELRAGRTPWAFALATEDTFATITLPPGTWRARVAARNQDAVLGPYSAPSDPITITGPDDRPNIQNPPIDGSDR